MRGQHFWNYFVSRKARCKILHSAWADTSVAWTVPSWKTMLKTTLDNGPRMKWLASKVTLMMKDHVSGHGTTLSVSGSPDHKGRQLKRRKGKGKGKHKGISWRSGRAFLGDKQAQDPEIWSEEDFAWWSTGNKGKKGLSKGNDGYQKGGFRPYHPDKGAGKDYHHNKGKGKDRKGKGKEGTYPQSRFSASETPNEKGYGHAWEWDDWSASHGTDDSWTSDTGWFCTKAHTAWMAVHSLNLAYHPTHVVLDLGCTRSIGSRAAIERLKKHAWYYGIATEFGRCNVSFVFANSETETCMESCIIHFPTTPPCSTKVDVLETGDVPILFSPSQMKNLGMTFELDPKRDKITCPAFGLFSSPAKIPQWDILCWTWQVLCISLRLNRAIDLVTQRNM